MKSRYGPQRRKLLALQCETRPPAPALPGDPDAESSRQLALSVPESVRALGEPLGPFLEACGGDQTLALAVHREGSDDRDTTYQLRQPFVVIGACRECDLPLVDSQVAFRHVYLQLVAGRWFLVDLWRLMRGTEAERAGASRWFDPGSTIEIGPYVVTRLPANPAADIARTARQEAALVVERPVEPQQVELELLNGRSHNRGTRRRRLTRAITLIGASPRCNLCLRDDGVSKVHASLVQTPGGLWVVDLLGRDGLSVDKRPAYWKQLYDGSELQIGRFKLRVHLGPARERRAAQLKPRSAGRRASDRAGALSEESILSLFQQMANMQSQFFEHSQMQLQLMTQMLAQLERGQQGVVRRDLARIDQIGRELHDIQAQLSPSASNALPRPAERPRPPGERSPAAQSAPESVDRPQPAALEPADPTAPAASPRRETAARQPAAEPADSPDAHDRLTRRMAKLAQERNNRWKRVLQAFARKPEA